jgi:hypothetical protein
MNVLNYAPIIHLHKGAYFNLHLPEDYGFVYTEKGLEPKIRF